MGATAALATEASSVEAVWAELNLHLSRSKAFSLFFLCSDSPAALERLRLRVEDAWMWRTAPMTRLSPRMPSTAAIEVLRSLESLVKEQPKLRVPVWVDLTAVDAAEANDWDLARIEVMSRLNEWRSWLQSTFRKPLLVALPRVWRQRMAQVAPDLWHVRTYSAAIAAEGTAAGVDIAEIRSALTVSSREPKGDDSLPVSIVVKQLLESGAVDVAIRLAETEAADARTKAASGEVGAVRDLSLKLFQLAYAQRHAGSVDAATRAYNEGLDLLRGLRLRLGDTPVVLRDLAVGLSKTGDARRHVGDVFGAVSAFHESLQFWMSFRMTSGDTAQTLRDIAVILSKLGNAQLESGDGIQAVATLTESVDICRQVRDLFKDESTQLLSDLAFSLDFLGLAQRSVGNTGAALAAYSESLDIRRRLIALTVESRESLRDFAVSRSRIGEMHLEARQGAAALESYREAVDVFRKLRARLMDDPVVLQNLTSTLNMLGEALQLTGQHSAALEVFAESLQLCREGRERSGKQVGSLRDLSLSLKLFGDASRDTHKRAEAIAAYTESLSVLRELDESFEDSAWVSQQTADVLQKLGEVHIAAGEGTGAIGFLEESVKLRRAAVEVAASTTALRDLSVSAALLGDANMSLGASVVSVPLYEESVAGFRNLRRQLGDQPAVLQDLARTLVVLGDALESLGDVDRAVATYAESLTLARQVRAQLGDSPNALAALAMSLERLACVGMTDGRTTQMQERAR